ncbi:hypothetical protein ACIRPF_38595, partial [Streptomyces erythrochromogenes]
TLPSRVRLADPYREHQPPRHPTRPTFVDNALEAGDTLAKARRATVLGRPIEHNQSPETDKAKERTPWLAMDLVFRPSSTVHIA